MGRGIVHRKVQTNRARDMGAPDHQLAGIGGLGLSSVHRDNPALVEGMLDPPPMKVAEEMVSVPRSAFDELVARVQALEGRAASDGVETSRPTTELANTLSSLS